MKVDTALRWWASLTLVIAAPVIGGFVEQLSVLSPVNELAANCELPLLTQAVFPRVAYLTEFGLAISAAVLLICAVCFRLLTPEVKKYRALTIIVTSGWALVALGILQVFLGMFVIPVAKCGM